MNKPLDIYASVVLHSGCARGGKNHKWDACPIQNFYNRIANKHQRKLNSNGLAIGVWIKKKQMLQDLQQIKEQKGDFLAVLDELIEDFS